MSIDFGPRLADVDPSLLEAENPDALDQQMRVEALAAIFWDLKRAGLNLDKIADVDNPRHGTLHEAARRMVDNAAAAEA